MLDVEPPDAVAPDDNSNASFFPIRLGVVSGSVARYRYGASLSACPLLKVASIVDSDVRRIRTWANAFGKETPVFANLKDMVESEHPPEVSLLDAPLSNRATALEILIDSGINRGILCPPPFSQTLEETDELLKRAKESGSLLFPSLPRRYDPIFAQAFELAKSGIVGALKQMRCDWSFPLNHLLGIELGADLAADHWNELLPYVMTHAIDSCRRCFGEVLSVSADIDSYEPDALANSRKPADTSHLLATLLLTHAEGSCSCHFSRSRSVQASERYIFSGERGFLELIVSSNSLESSWLPQLILHLNGQRPQPVPPPSPLLPEDNAPAIRNSAMLEDFARSVLKFCETEVQDREARSLQEIVQAAYLSVEEKRKMALPLRRSAPVRSRLKELRLDR